MEIQPLLRGGYNLMAAVPADQAETAAIATDQRRQSGWSHGSDQNLPSVSLLPEEQEFPMEAVQLNERYRIVLDKETRRVVVQVVDPESQVVIETIPPEQVMKVLAEMGKTLGQLVNKHT